ncbi:MAG: type I 3-dehydroquinate dehydratase [Archaeoglobaceae archaeon]
MKLVATVSSVEEARIAEKADVLEFRLDIADIEFETAKEKILTIRRREDGGAYEGSEELRLRRIVEMSKEFDYVDLEVDVPDWVFDEVSADVIESYHNFAGTPDYDFLRCLAENRRGDILKVATMGRSGEDVKKIARLLVEHENVVAFLMGEKFSFTRVMAAMLGSPLVYCYVGKPKAPGQLELNFAYELFRRLGLR